MHIVTVKRLRPPCRETHCFFASASALIDPPPALQRPDDVPVVLCGRAKPLPEYLKIPACDSWRPMQMLPPPVFWIPHLSPKIHFLRTFFEPRSPLKPMKSSCLVVMMLGADRFRLVCNRVDRSLPLLSSMHFDLSIPRPCMVSLPACSTLTRGPCR